MINKNNTKCVGGCGQEATKKIPGHDPFVPKGYSSIPVCGDYPGCFFKVMEKINKKGNEEKTR